MERRLRTPEELEGILCDNPGLRTLYEGLSGIKGIDVQPDGRGEGVFKVYLMGRLDANEGFLRVNTLLDRCFVEWSHQREFTDRCRALWGPIVKNPTNDVGSELRGDLDIETVLRIVQQYANLETSAS